jgi:hypothetical protein
MLIYRSMIEVAEGDFVAVGARHVFADWLARKIRSEFDLVGGEITRDNTKYEWTTASDSTSPVSVFRGHLFEDRGGEQVRLTSTAVSDGSMSWAWTDVERWTERFFERGWVPYAPTLVTLILSNYSCTLAGVNAGPRHETVNGDAARLLCEHLLHPDRAVPVVVVSPTRAEREGDINPCEERANELQRRLAGVARVITLGAGATSELSRCLTEAVGAGFDVHSGAVRTYLPRMGYPKDGPWRHRVIPFHRLHGRPAETAARLISLPLVQASCLQPPPTIWQTEGRKLPAFAAGGGANEEVDQILAEAEAERDAARRTADEAELRRLEDRETVDEVLGQLDLLTRRLAYLERELRKANADALAGQPHDPVFQPEWCEEVALEAMGNLDLVVVGPGVVDAAGSLDVHADNASWARKAWRSLQALQAYGNAKQSGDAGSWDFKLWCDHSGHPAAIPDTWVAMHESATTDNNPRFRRLRTLPVAAEVDATGHVYMAAHIKIERGGTPCPRIHFFDDTEGATGKVHIGWFGDHLDSSAKS